MKLSKLGDNSFETDFRSMAESIILPQVGKILDINYSYDETSDETVYFSKYTEY